MQSLETIDLSNLQSDSEDVISANITNLAGLIFNNSPKLANITIAGPIPSIPNYAFKGCTGLQNVDFTLLPNITSIGTGAFQNTTVEKVDLTQCKKLTTIGQDAFRGANIKALDLSGCDALTTIQNNAFTEVATNADTPMTLTFPASLTTLNNNTFWGSNISEIVFPENSQLQSIGQDAFRTSKLTNLDFSNCKNLNSIGVTAFRDTPNLQTVKFANDSTVTLNSSVFEGSNVSSVDLSNTKITSISEGLFRNCTNLTELKLPNTINSFGNESLRGTTSLTALDLTNLTSSRLTLGNSVFYGSGFSEISSQDPSANGSTTKANVTTLAFPKNKEIIVGTYVFAAMPNLTKAVFESTSTTNTTSSTMGTVYNMFDGSTKLATIDLSRCALPIVGNNGHNNSTYANFMNTAVSEIKIGNYSGAEVATGQLLLADNISTIKNWQFSQMPSLTKLNFTEATKLASIWNNAWDQSNITEIQYPVDQKMTITSDLVINMTAQSAIAIYANSFNATAIQQLTESMPITTKNVKWANTTSTNNGSDNTPATYSCSPGGLINNAGIRKIDLSQLGVPAGNTNGNTNGPIANNTPANMYAGNYFPQNAGNWNTVALSGNFSGNTALTNAIFDTAAFNLLNPNWSTIEFGHQNYSATTNGQAVNNKIDLANIMNNFGGLFYTSAGNGSSGQQTPITLVTDGTNWTAPTNSPTAPTTPVEGFGTIEADLDATTVVQSWTQVNGSNTKTKVHNGVTWTYTPGDNATGKLASLEATVLSMKVYNKNGSNATQQVKYFSGNPAWTSAEQMVKNMKKKTIRIFFNDNSSNGGITIS